MSLWKKITVTVVVLMVVVGIGYDIIALIMGGVESTISQVVLNKAREHPIIAFAMGVLCGHLFWPQRGQYQRGYEQGRKEWEAACKADFETDESTG